ncbi:molybdenum ABC transporter ATP-binding protein [Aliiruegeria sabulilitoris]|uniref:molybdenum ABC transporter ATP-binding protein n=1 Tax=Aliiruegeria sabulilitoris TaxID=1510458 RepID=UPI00083362C3|nr:molybdenum ABC transporter ATP-binding protein [Aliiruegeria sabulilitoris]NDR56827.1 molybdenum ABC transporter ATP-binding protein [Pseudoruegeria sp. M32A2M]
MTLSVDLTHRRDGFTLETGFESPDGVTALFGHSGAGKTTVVQAVAGLLHPDSGRIAVGDWVLQDSAAGLWLPPHRRRVGYVFQDGRLFPHMSVGRNLDYGRRMNRLARDPAREQRVLDMLGIAPLLDRHPVGLSGGEQQRVAIGRALLSTPRLLLLDEPLAALDAARKEEILPYLERLRDEARVPILYVSHSMAEVARLATHVVVLREGKVLRSGLAPQVLSDPATVPALGPQEAGALLEVRVEQHHEDGLTAVATSAGTLLLLGVTAPPGTQLRVRIPAHEVILALEPPRQISALNILPARVLALRPGDGAGMMVQLESGTDRLLSRVTKRSAQALGLQPGRECHAIVKSVAVARSDIGAGGSV